MKKLIAITIALLSITISCQMSEAAVKTKTIKADIQSVRVPKGTTLKLQLIDPITSRAGNLGDEFTAMLINDEIVESKVALPAGSIFRGNITKIIPSRLPSRSAVVYLNFDHVVSPTGRQIPVAVGLLNYPEITIDGGIYQGGNYGWAVKQNWAKTKKIAITATNWGKTTGNNMQYVCTPIGAIGGVFGGGVYLVGDTIIDLFRKGNAVTLLQGKEIEVMLTQPIDIPLH